MKLTYLLIGLLVLGFAMPMVLAEDNTSIDDNGSAAIALYNDTSNLEPGILISPAPTNAEDTQIQNEAAQDDNATIGFGEIGWNNVQLWFTFNQEKKAELELKLARLRLIEARIAAKNNNTAAMEKALDAHERLIQSIEKRTEALKKANESIEKLRGLDRAIQVHNERINRLNDMLANGNLTAEQKDKVEARLAHVENVTSKLAGVQTKINARIDAKVAELRSRIEARKINNNSEAG